MIVDLDNDAYALNKIMDFDHVIRVHENGSVSWAPNMYAPTLYVDEDGTEYFEGEGWTLLSGYTGQYLYSGPVMHPSEFIGGQMARDILSEPGYYVAILADCLEDEEEPAGWAVARKDIT